MSNGKNYLIIIKINCKDIGSVCGDQVYYITDWFCYRKQEKVTSCLWSSDHSHNFLSGLNSLSQNGVLLTFF